MPGSRKLRSALADAQAIQLPAVYVERLEALKNEFGHSIVLLEEGRAQIRRFNCFAYALGVWDNPAYQEMVSAHVEDQLALINSALVSKWITRGFLEKSNWATPVPMTSWPTFFGASWCILPDPARRAFYTRNGVPTRSTRTESGKSRPITVTRFVTLGGRLRRRCYANWQASDECQTFPMLPTRFHLLSTLPGFNPGTKRSILFEIIEEFAIFGGGS